MMKKYKENEVHRDMLYEEQKREKLKAAMEERLAAEKKQKEIAENMEEPDPWLKSKFTEAPENETTPASETAPTTEADTETYVDGPNETKSQESTNTTESVKEV